MKILHVTKKYPNALGGDSVVVSNLEKQQILNGHKVVILTSNCDEIKDGKHIYRFGLKDTPASLDNITLKRLISLIMLFFKAFKVFRVERPDVIHTHSVDMAFSISFAARFYKIPIVHTFHIVTFYDENHTFIRRKTELFFVRGAQASKITAPNIYDVNKLKKAGLKQTMLVMNGIDLDYWKKSKQSQKKRCFTFIAIGRLEEQKGYEYLIKAAALLRLTTKIKFKIIIVGDGSLKEKLQRLVKSLGIVGCVKFTGRKDQAEVKNIYSNSDAFVLPSLYETTPLTLLEAWAMQVPAITTRVGISRELSNNSSVLLINMRDEKSLERAMFKFMVDPNTCNQFASVAYKKVQDFTWPKITNLFENIYQKALR